MKNERSNMAWYNRSAADVLETLESRIEGLSTQEADLRLAADGSNELREGKRVSLASVLVGQFKGLIVWILIAAGVLSGMLGEIVDAAAIFAIVILNAMIGFYQEWNAERSIAALMKMTEPKAKVRRDGKVNSIPASEIVVGDILTMEAGDIVPADCRLLETASLMCIESALTGESEAVDKKAITLQQADLPLGDRENLIFMGTAIASGTAKAVVVGTAMQTEIGHIASLLGQAVAEEGTEGTPLQHKLAAFGRVLVWASSVCCSCWA